MRLLCMQLLQRFFLVRFIFIEFFVALDDDLTVSHYSLPPALCPLS